MEEKICTKCKELKDISEFTIRKDRPCGYLSACKKCVKEVQLAFREKNREKLRLYAENYYTQNKEVSLMKAKTYRQNNKEIMSIANKKWRSNNSEYVKEYQKTYQNNNKLKIVEQKRIYSKNRRHNDELYATTLRLRHRLNNIFKNKSFKKYKTTTELIGCDFKTAFNYIESLFIEGMSWDNRSEWHIDHIIPLASATTEKELIKLCHYINLQPLWVKDNLKKGSKIITE